MGNKKLSVVVEDSLSNAKRSGYTSISDILPTVMMNCKQTFSRETDIVRFDFQRTPFKNHLVELAAQAYIKTATLSCCKQSLTNGQQNQLARLFWRNVISYIGSRKGNHWQPKIVEKISFYFKQVAFVMEKSYSFLRRNIYRLEGS
ncbi:hypothetical protein O6H91_22G028300 [Diphasiastrum complanatum]|nr:hypothetical protein O6H91_22G028300 [Diphasiastrum complanatum]